MAAKARTRRSQITPPLVCKLANDGRPGRTKADFATKSENWLILLSSYLTVCVFMALLLYPRTFIIEKSGRNPATQKSGLPSPDASGLGEERVQILIRLI